MLRLKVMPMHRRQKVARRREPALHERCVEDQLGAVIVERVRLPRFDLPPERFEISLDLVHADRYQLDKIEVLRVLVKDNFYRLKR